MRQMKHKLLSRSVVVLSLTLSLAIAALWWRSQSWGYSADYSTPGRRVFGLYTYTGTLQAYYGWNTLDSQLPKDPTAGFSFSSRQYWVTVPTPPELAARGLTLGPRQPPPIPGRFGFGYEDQVVPVAAGVLPNGTHLPTSTSHNLGLFTPLWLYILIALIAPMRALIRWRRTRIRTARGLCLICGYDLRSTPDQCPECGTPSAPSIT